MMQRADPLFFFFFKKNLIYFYYAQSVHFSDMLTMLKTKKQKIEQMIQKRKNKRGLNSANVRKKNGIRTAP